MNIYKINLLLLLGLLMNTPLVAQNNYLTGYTINVSGDTIPGLVMEASDRTNAQICTFKKNASAEVQKLSPAEIKGFGYTQGRKYESYEIQLAENNKIQVFLELLAKGEANLYYFRDTTKTEERFFFKNQEIDFLELKNEKITRYIDGQKYTQDSDTYKRQLRAVLTKCSKLVHKINRTRFYRPSLTRLINEYNQCANPSLAKDLKTEKSNIATAMGVLLGYTNSGLSFVGEDETLESANFPNHGSFTAGAFFRIYPKRLFNNLSFQIEVSYHQEEFVSDSAQRPFRSTGEESKRVYTFESEYIRIPISVQYTIPIKKMRPYFRLGVSNAFLINGFQEEVRSNIPLGGTVARITTSDPIPDRILRNFELGFIGGLGLEVPISSKTFIGLEGRYEGAYTLYISRFPVEGRAQRFSLLLSFGF